MPRYGHVTNATHGATAITTIKSIDYNEAGGRLTGMGDKDLYPTTQMKGAGDVTGTVVLEDPIQARALRAAAEADLQFEGVAEGSGANLEVTIENVTFFSLAGRDAHNALSQRTLGFAARSNDGQASPVAEIPKA